DCRSGRPTGTRKRLPHICAPRSSRSSKCAGHSRTAPASWSGRGRARRAKPVSRKELASHRLRPLAERVLSLAGGAADRMPVRAAVEHMIAVTYGMTYDVVVTRFGPYEAMIDEIVSLVTRSVPVTQSPRSIKVLDIACGI